MIWKLVVLSVLFAVCLRAEMVYYFPFDNGASASLSNFGTLGGFATPTNKNNTVSSYPASVATNTPLWTPFVERFPVTSDATGGYLTIANSADKLRLVAEDGNPGGAITISTWVNWKGHGGLASHIDSCILSTMEGGMNSGFRLIINSGGGLTFVYCRTSNHNGGSGFTISSNEWIHITARWKSSYPQTSQIATNGFVSTYNNWSGSGLAATNASPIRIGAMDSVNGYRPLNGLLDELAVWDEYLPDAQVKTLYRIPATLTTSNEVYTVAAISSLWSLHSTSNSTPTVLVGKRTWRYAAVLPAGHTAGEVWLNPTTQKAYIQLGAATGLEGLPPPEGTRIRLY